MTNARTGRKQEAALTRRALLAEGARILAKAGVENARQEAEWLLTDELGETRAQFYAHSEDAVSSETADAFHARLRRRADGEPLQYVLGHADFFGLRLSVSPAVLIPRPETENVVEAALARLSDTRTPRILDVGTGSGCIALALKSERPDAEVWACDVSAEARTVARANAHATGLDVHLFHADVQAETLPPETPTGLDLLVSNPPYVPDVEADMLPSSVRAHEPATALFSGPDPLCFYRALERHGAARLAPGGHLVFETHAHHAGAVAALLHADDWEDVAVESDAFGRERIVTGRRSPHST